MWSMRHAESAKDKALESVERVSALRHQNMRAQRACKSTEKADSFST